MVPKQCPFRRPTIWYLVYCATCLGSRDNSKYHTHPHTYIPTYMTQVGFPSIVWLRLRAFGAQPPSELLNYAMLYYESTQFLNSLIKMSQFLPFSIATVYALAFLWCHFHDVARFLSELQQLLLHSLLPSPTLCKHSVWSCRIHAHPPPGHPPPELAVENGGRLELLRGRGRGRGLTLSKAAQQVERRFSGG